MGRFKKVHLSIAIFLFSLIVRKAFSEPPYLSDDPSPTDYHQWEAYAFSQNYITNTPQTTIYSTSPAVEVDYGLLPNLEIHLLVPWANYYLQDSFSASGIGDTEIGLKYRFINETSSTPAVAFAPLFELPTGNGALDLGNGAYWMRIPIWMEKNWDSWTSYAGGGYVINTAVGGLNYFYGGWVLQHSVTKKLKIGGELYSQSRANTNTDKTDPFDEPTTIVDMGCIYNFSENLGLRFSGGFAIFGQPQFVSYIGIYWSGGGGS